MVFRRRAEVHSNSLQEVVHMTRHASGLKPAIRTDATRPSCGLFDIAFCATGSACAAREQR